ncbi:MAG TPA: hypothetical protein PKA58_26690, partial [Polyangium sp.]|nr:hypothetical protein [Polyangium sp.]
VVSVDSPKPAVSAVAEEAPSSSNETPVGSAPFAPPKPDEPEERDCDPGGPPPVVCVAPSQTEGPPASSLFTGAAGGCRSAPKESICRGCRPDFVKFEKGSCCYQGLSRFPRCKKHR